MADPSTAPPLIPSSIAEAHGRIKDYIHETPLITSKTLSAIASHPNPSLFLSPNPPPLSQSQSNTQTNGHQTDPTTTTAPKVNLYFKCENEQKIGAFKARGAHHALVRLISVHGIEYVRQRGVITHSSGNHAQALALAAKTFNVPACIVMPSISTPSKIAGTKMYTDDVVFSGSTATEREAKVAEIMERTGAILVPPYDHPDIILGQGTAAYEMERQFQDLKRNEQKPPSSINTTDDNNNNNNNDDDDAPPRFDIVLAPLGGGGLLGGTATWFSHTHPQSQTQTTTKTATTTTAKQTLVIGTEPSHESANDAERGLSQTPPARIPHVSSLTIADGLRTPVGLLNWTIVSDRSKVHAVYSVAEREIKMALKLVLERAKVFVEPSAVVPVAVVLFCRAFRDWLVREQAGEDGGRRAWDVGVILSGGNTTVEALSHLFAETDWVARGEDAGDREAGLVGLDGEKVAQDVAG